MLTLNAEVEKEYKPVGLTTRFITLLGDIMVFGLLYLLLVKWLFPYLMRLLMGYNAYELAHMDKFFPFWILFAGFYMGFQVSNWQAPFCLYYAGGKVITPDGKQPCFKGILIRSVPLLILCMAPTTIKVKGFCALVTLIWSFFSVISLLTTANKNKQGWHDRIAKCLVVQKRVPTDQYYPRPAPSTFSGTIPSTGDPNGVSQLLYDAKDGQLFALWGINLLLKMVTFGIYTFWGKTRLRRYITGSFSLHNDRFEYTGTGGELFKGFLKALPIIIVMYAPFIIWEPKHHPAVQLMFIPIFFLIYAGTYAGLRYKFSRTTWRGIRGRITGSALEYASLKMARGFLNIITLGIAVPYSDIKIQKYRMEHSYFGSAKAEFSGNGAALMRTNIMTLLLIIPTLGLSRFWYNAALARYVYESTTFNTIRFKGNQTGANMLGLFAGNILLAILTVGLGVPIVMQRNMRYLADNLVIIGDIATSGIHQSTETLGTSGEGIYGLLGDMDIGFL